MQIFSRFRGVQFTFSPSYNELTVACIYHARRCHRIAKLVKFSDQRPVICDEAQPFYSMLFSRIKF